QGEPAVPPGMAQALDQNEDGHQHPESQGHLQHAAAGVVHEGRGEEEQGGGAHAGRGAHRELRDPIGAGQGAERHQDRGQPRGQVVLPEEGERAGREPDLERRVLESGPVRPGHREEVAAALHLDGLARIEAIVERGQAELPGVGGEEDRAGQEQDGQLATGPRGGGRGGGLRWGLQLRAAVYTVLYSARTFTRAEARRWPWTLWEWWRPGGWWARSRPPTPW